MILAPIVVAIAMAAVYAQDTMTVTRTTYIGSDCPHSYAEHTMETCKVFTIPARITDMSRFDQGVVAELKTKVSDPSVRSSISAAMATRISQASSKITSVAQEQGISSATMSWSRPIQQQQQQQQSFTGENEQVINNWSAGNVIGNDMSGSTTTFKGAVFSASSALDSGSTQVPFYWNQQSSSSGSEPAASLPNDGAVIKADAVTSNTDLSGAQVAVASNQQQQQQQQQDGSSSGWKKVVGSEVVGSNNNAASGGVSSSNQAASGSNSASSGGSSSGGQTVGYRVYQYGSDIPVA